MSGVASLQTLEVRTFPSLLPPGYHIRSHLTMTQLCLLGGSPNGTSSSYWNTWELLLPTQQKFLILELLFWLKSFIKLKENLNPIYFSLSWLLKSMFPRDPSKQSLGVLRPHPLSSTLNCVLQEGNVLPVQFWTAKLLEVKQSNGCFCGAQTLCTDSYNLWMKLFWLNEQVNGVLILF